MRITVFVAALLLTGCASITSESMQLVRVDAVDETGEKVTDARCTLTNDKGSLSQRQVSMPGLVNPAKI